MFIFISTEPPNSPFPTIHQCMLVPPQRRYNQSCELQTYFSRDIVCSVQGYYPTITLHVHFNSSHVNSDMREWNNIDGTKSKSITIHAVPSPESYNCEVSHIPGSGPDRKESATITILSTRGHWGSNGNRKPKLKTEAELNNKRVPYASKQIYLFIIFCQKVL